MAIEKQMCDFLEIHGQRVEMIHSPEDAPKWIRCPTCGRRLKPRLYDCHRYSGDLSVGAPCWHWKIPPHKKKGWWKIGRTKKTSRRTS